MIRPSITLTYSRNAILLNQFTLALTGVSPVPEPETYALRVAGLGLVGFIELRVKEQPPSLIEYLNITPLYTGFFEDRVKPML